MYWIVFDVGNLRLLVLWLDKSVVDEIENLTKVLL